MRCLLTTLLALSLVTLSGCGDDDAATASGRSADDAQEAKEVAKSQKDGVIGKWRDNVTNPIFHSAVTILVEDGKIYYLNEYDDGSEKRMQLVETESDLGRRFDPVFETRMGDHWVVDENGDLLMRDKHGTAAVAKKIQ